MKLLKKILMTFIWIILILLVTFNVYNFVSIKLLHKELPKIFGYSVLEVVSGSMEPTIMVGDLIVIDTDCENYQKGDIITFRDVNGSFVTHRILEIGVDEMITKGDNNDSQDEAMSPATIVGKYVTRIPQLGSVMSSLKNPLVMALILAIGIIVCFLVSTDKDLKPKLTDEEKEFLEFKKFKEEEEKKKKEELVEKEKVVIESSLVEVEEIAKPPKESTNVSKKVDNRQIAQKKNNKKKNYNNNKYQKGNTNNNRYSSNNATNNQRNSQKNKTNNSAHSKGQGNNGNTKKNYSQYNKKTNTNNRAQVNNKNQKKNNYNNQNKKKQQNSTKNK